jgi:NADP-dependent 3-hydroxy acid dehydrogenase YdfG
MLAEQGANLILVARREDKLESVKDEVTANHPDVEVTCIPFDLTKTEEIVPFFETLKVDILVSNAGLALGFSKADAVSMTDVHTLMATNLTASIAIFRALVPGMRTRNTGHVAFIGSVAGFESYEGGSIYNASKHGLLGFANAARMDLVDTKVRVSIINPGMVGTDFWTVRARGDEQLAQKSLQGIEPLSEFDIADQVMYCLTRRTTCAISEIRSYPNHQAHAKYVIFRES